MHSHVSICLLICLFFIFFKTKFFNVWDCKLTASNGWDYFDYTNCTVFWLHKIMFQAASNMHIIIKSKFLRNYMIQFSITWVEIIAKVAQPRCWHLNYIFLNTSVSNIIPKLMPIESWIPDSFSVFGKWKNKFWITCLWMVESRELVLISYNMSCSSKDTFSHWLLS